MTEPATGATNVTWHPSSGTREERWEALGQRGAVVWFTGLSGSGKSTVAVEVEAHGLAMWNETVVERIERGPTGLRLSTSRGPLEVDAALSGHEAHGDVEEAERQGAGPDGAHGSHLCEEGP